MTNKPSGAAAAWPVPTAAAAEYLSDAWQCSLISWDQVREHGNQFLEHEKTGNPRCWRSTLSDPDELRRLLLSIT